MCVHTYVYIGEAKGLISDPGKERKSAKRVVERKYSSLAMILLLWDTVFTSLCDCASFHCYPAAVTDTLRCVLYTRTYCLLWLQLRTPIHFVFLKYTLKPHYTPIPEVSMPGITLCWIPTC